MNFQEFTDDWESKAANIEADLLHGQNLDEHYLTVESMLSKLRTMSQAAEWLEETDLTRWQVLGFQMHELRNALFGKIEMFNPNIIQQLRALSKGTIKAAALYDVTLTNHNTVSETAYLEGLRQQFNILDAFITADKTLIVLFSDYQPDTIAMTATAFGRGVANAGLNIKKILFYGAPIFEQPLNYPSS
ncbi:hypothetical protein HH214_06125 [Mucilaginibacter robiniae]|uniref:Uncharacterized protein n=1 Tax=Mucilaginibacter robiniae TaxID=2728022 RepID=A0A7L5DXJ0_9SPHI|nr:hypothetical protein [Mucilaginibacter robiniae]QJD95481.1 hypothetical protein HH214_06125 [Mucilaginibacter robiniae]